MSSIPPYKNPFSDKNKCFRRGQTIGKTSERPLHNKFNNTITYSDTNTNTPVLILILILIGILIEESYNDSDTIIETVTKGETNTKTNTEYLFFVLPVLRLVLPEVRGHRGHLRTESFP